MKVVKRDGRLEEVRLEKITKRISGMTRNLNNVEAFLIAQRVIGGLYDGVTTSELDELAVKTAANLSTTHPDYDSLAARLCISMLHKETKADFAETMEDLYNREDKHGNHRPYVNENFIKVIRKHKQAINAEIIYRRDYDFDYLGIETLKKSYLAKLNGKIVERPQHMWMRVSLGIHGYDLEAAFDTYHKMSKKMMTHATPTLFNAGTVGENLISCFLLSIDSDSIVGENYESEGKIGGIYKTLADCAAISKMAGGIGIHVHKIRSAGVPIYGTGGMSNGLVPMLKAFDSTASYVDQGGGRRKGSFAIYLTPSHPDIFEFLDLKKNIGKDEIRCRNLFYGLWIPDIFMERVKENGQWTLMDPVMCPGLEDCHSEEYKELYLKYEEEGKGQRTVPAQELFRKILETQIETSMPYMCYKDAANRKSNQQNLGVIQSSNLCAEIYEISNSEEIAACNLASLALPAFVEGEKRIRFNHKKLHLATKRATFNLNKVIDVNQYPVIEAKTSNSKHRPIGIGVQGLADVLLKMKINWDSQEAYKLNLEIFETMHHAALEASMEAAIKDGPYSTWEGSPASKGQLQYDLWFKDVKKRYPLFKNSTSFEWKDPETCETAEEYYCSDRYDWADLKEKIKENGLRNSLLIALMPTASTASILGNIASFEPIQSNIYKRNVLSGEFIRVNKYLVAELQRLDLWNDRMKQRIIAAEGSVQDIKEIPEDVRKLFRTVWEISQKALIELSAARGAFVCQSQSFNLYFKDATFRKLSSAHMYGWMMGNKTGSYYIRQQASRQAQKFTVDVEIQKELEQNRNDEADYQKARQILLERGFSEEDLSKWDRKTIIANGIEACSIDGDEDCLMCGS